MERVLRMCESQGCISSVTSYFKENSSTGVRVVSYALIKQEQTILQYDTVHFAAFPGNDLYSRKLVLREDT